ncbi:hypothetical protein [Pseudoalteromonas byunsanensis]|uniref:Cardiolipin synthase N-terminal domain-containing protein n=1 Tax=Pseudoalteromonas byunsanensis TaxID=327939 RepID=A0A1S1NC89_9GAMM|nr:hypothetical protein [Pseudoalteromonas byunsanensis]OHU96331.1 hypothetical protein BIW53_07250 [Pseudoalteromonas byunsanensis]
MNELILLFIAVCGYLIPLAIISGSKRTKGHEKNGWLIGTLLFSWLTLLLYFSIVPKGGVQLEKEKKPRSRRRH